MHQGYRLWRANNKDGTLSRPHDVEMTDRPAASGGATTPPAGPSPNRGMMIVLAYLWLLALVPLLLEKQDPEVQWHAKHGLVLTIAELVFWAAAFVSTSLLALTTVAAGFVISLFAIVAWLGVLALHFAAVVKGVNGGHLMVPGISRYADRL
jgi:uncharacterized membrane protein